MNRQQELNRLGAEGFRKAYGEQAYDAMLAKSAQEKFNATLDKVKAILGGIGTALAPVLDFLVMVVDNPIAPYFISALIAMKAMKALKLGSMFGSMAANSGNTLNSLKGMVSKAKDLVLGKKIGGQFIEGGGRAPAGARAGFMGQGGIGGKVKGLFKKDKEGGIIKKIKNTIPDSKNLNPKGVSEASKLSNKAKPGAGKGIKENLKGLAAGLRSMGIGPVLKGVVNLAAFGVASVPAIASIPFLLFMGLTPLKLIKSNMQALAAGLRSFGTGKVMAGIGAFTLLSLASIAMIPGSVGLLMFGGAAYVAAAGMAVLTPALVSLGTAMASGVGALGLAALVVAAVGLGAAFALVGVGALAMGKGIKLSAEGFAIMVPSILSLLPAIPGLFLLGGALLSVSAGLAAISITGLLATPALLAIGLATAMIGAGLNLATPALSAISEIIPTVTEGFTTMFNSVSANIGPLLLLGPALLGISAGLAAMGVTGLLAMPTIFALTALGSVSEGLSSIFGGDDDETQTTSKNNEMAGVEKKLDTLISLIEQGGDVYIDGAKVGKSLQLASSKVG